MITNEQWEAIKNDFTCYSIHIVKFKYQIHEIAIEKYSKSATTNKFAVYFDGVIKSEWQITENKGINNLKKIFWCYKKKKIFSQEVIADLEKKAGKKAVKPLKLECYEYYTPIFSNLNKMINQFKKVDGLELIIDKE